MDMASSNQMQTIIEDFQSASKASDLFGYWQHELQLRQQLRAAVDSKNTQISTQAEYDFLKRSLYYGSGRNIFFAIMVRNMNKQAILESMLVSPSEFIIDFLDYLTVYVKNQNPSPQDLSFLINIFREDYLPEYMELVEVINEDLGKYLVGRTSNKTLRRLLNDRLATIKETKQIKNVPGDTNRPKGWPTIHGDKIQLLTLAADMLTELDQNAAINQEQNVDEIIDCASLLFRAGLLSDCIGLLTRTLSNPVFENDNPILDRSDSYYRQVNRLLGKVIPLYSLLISPVSSHEYTLQNYRSLFPGFSPDPVSLIYLDLYAIIQAGILGQRQYARYEIIQKAAKIHSLNREDRLALNLVNLGFKRTLDHPDDLLDSWTEELKQYPHTIYISLEILRFCHLQGITYLNKKTASAMLRMYLELFYWLPGTPFINDGLVKHLGPLANDDCRVEAANIAAHYKYIHQDSLLSTVPTEPIAAEPHLLTKIMDMSKIMGVF